MNSRKTKPTSYQLRKRQEPEATVPQKDRNLADEIRKLTASVSTWVEVSDVRNELSSVHSSISDLNAKINRADDERSALRAEVDRMVGTLQSMESRKNDPLSSNAEQNVLISLFRSNPTTVILSLVVVGLVALGIIYVAMNSKRGPEEWAPIIQELRKPVPGAAEAENPTAESNYEELP